MKIYVNNPSALGPDYELRFGGWRDWSEISRDSAGEDDGWERRWQGNGRRRGVIAEFSRNDFKARLSGQNLNIALVRHISQRNMQFILARRHIAYDKIFLPDAVGSNRCGIGALLA